MERSLDRKSDPDSNTGDHNVPKSQSSSSGVNESDSVSSSEDQKIDRRKDKSTGGVDVPSFNDVLNLLKFSYILQVSTKYLFYYLIHPILDSHSIMRVQNGVPMSVIHNLSHVLFFVSTIMLLNDFCII